MIMWASTMPARPRRPGRLAAAAALAALACVVVIESLHGHACTGDGCVLCLAACAAHGLLGGCAAALLAESAFCVLAAVKLPRVAVLFRRDVLAALVGARPTPRVEPTPVSMGVRLLI